MELEKVALSEGRSLAQICEVFLAGGLEIYRKEGSKYLQRFLARQKKEDPTDWNIGTKAKEPILKFPDSSL
jgi:hypothetical protein